MVKTFKSGGGQIKPRGCGIAKRGFGKAMKGKQVQNGSKNKKEKCTKR